MSAPGSKMPALPSSQQGTHTAHASDSAPSDPRRLGSSRESTDLRERHRRKDAAVHKPPRASYSAKRSVLPVPSQWVPCMSLVCPATYLWSPSWRGREGTKKSGKANLVGSEAHQIFAYIRIILVVFFCVCDNMSFVNTWIVKSWPQNL